MKINKIIILIALFIAFLNFNSASAQIKEGESIDKILAVVGNEIITLSDVNAQMIMLLQSNPKYNMNDPELKKQVLNALINEKLVITKAIEDSVVVSDEEIDQRWDFQLQQYVQYYGSEKRIEDIFGRSISQIRYEARDIIKKKLLAEKIQQKKFMNVKVNPREVEEFYKNFKDSLEKVPQQIELCHIVKYISASNQAKEEAYNLAKKIRDSILNGGDFSDFARRYSKDPGSAASGGDLGWFTKGKLIREYEKAAFDLQPEQISQPIETPFGYHIIKTIDKKKDSILTKHILFKFGESSDDVERAKKYLLELKEKVAKGENFEDLAKKYSEEKETQGFGGLIGKIPVSKIPDDMKDIVLKLPIGGVSDPLIYTSDKNKSAFHIIYKKADIPEHIPTFEGDYKDIEQYALNYKQMKLYQQWIDELRGKMYWEIKQ